eukprot:TRINITY_DN19340_c0_g1_i1.p1 TRINITY_DN19340_c0_g1~~TRINITY_DN19340_c0_g1_i1.p1  ORF type:complete len:450 (+),score=106.28 TRINITY_DN19340_c0_g1_i1:45-1352(+)
MDLDVIDLKLDMHHKTFDAGLKESTRRGEAYEKKKVGQGQARPAPRFWSVLMRGGDVKRPVSAEAQSIRSYDHRTPDKKEKEEGSIQRLLAKNSQRTCLGSPKAQFVFRNKEDAVPSPRSTIPFPLDASKIIGIPSNVIPALLHPAVHEVVPPEHTLNHLIPRMPPVRTSLPNTGMHIPQGSTLQGSMIAVTYKSETAGMRCICLGELIDGAKQGIKYHPRVRHKPLAATGKHRQTTDEALQKIEGYSITHKIKLSDASLEETLQGYLKGCLEHRKDTVNKEKPVMTKTKPQGQDTCFADYSRFLMVPTMVVRYKVVHAMFKKKVPTDLAQQPLMALLAGDKKPQQTTEHYKPKHTITPYEYTTTWRVPIAELMANPVPYVKQNHGSLHRLEYSEPVPLNKLLGSCENGSCTVEVMNTQHNVPVTRHSFTYGYDL